MAKTIKYLLSNYCIELSLLISRLRKQEFFSLLIILFVWSNLISQLWGLYPIIIKQTQQILVLSWSSSISHTLCTIYCLSVVHRWCQYQKETYFYSRKGDYGTSLCLCYIYRTIIWSTHPLWEFSNATYISIFYRKEFS